MTRVVRPPPPPPPRGTPSVGGARDDATVTQTARLEGAFTADLVHDVLVRASADVGAAKTTVTMGAPELLGSQVTRGEDGSIVVEDQVEVRVILTTKREITTMVDLLDRAHVENGRLELSPVAHDATLGGAP